MRTASGRSEWRRGLMGRARSAARPGLELLGEVTSQRRPLPDFLIIGAQKAATTALYHYLTQHPGVRPAIMKEVHYFDLHHERGERWYRGHFPQRLDPMRSTPSFVTGEASPYYLFHPLVPDRVVTLLPDVKLIVLLRDPVRRAISQYHHEVSHGFETRSMTQAIREEPDMLLAEEARLAAGLPPSTAHQHGSYLSRGLYAEQLLRWMHRFPKDQLLIVSSDRLSKDGGITYRRVLAFLGLPSDGRTSFERVHGQTYPAPDPDLVARIREYYVRPNRRLVALIGHERADEFPWLAGSMVPGGDAGIRTLDGAQHPVTA